MTNEMETGGAISADQRDLATGRQSQDRRRLRVWVHASIGIAAVAVPLVVSVLPLRPPAVVPADAPDSEFSAARAMKHVRQIASAPHPVGSASLRAARDYLVDTLETLGVGPEVQTVEVRHRRYMGPVHNVVARLRGPRHDDAVMLSAHYDSVREGPGAADDASAVAALLETLRALQAGPALDRDVIFLFTDSEEIARLGSKVFMQQHRWRDDIAVALNFEARGSGGPTYMFETSPGNRNLVHALAAAAPRPLASSLTDEVYRRLPNDTDFTIFRRYGLPGMNFAFIGGFVDYHTAHDSPDRLDQRSLQHQGTYALSLTRHFAEHGAHRSEHDDVYFNLVRSGLVRYPEHAVVPLAVAALLVMAMAWALAIRRGIVRPVGLLVGAGSAGLAIASGVVLAIAIVQLAPLWHRGDLLGPEDATGNAHLYAGGLVLLVAALLGSLYGRLVRRHTTEELALGAWVWWAGALLATVAFAPGASYLFTWPLLLGAAGAAVSLVRSWPTLLRGVLLVAPTVPAVLLLTPAAVGMFVAVRLTLYPVVVALVVLAATMLLPHIRALGAAFGPRLFSAAAVVGVGMILYAGMSA